MAAVTAAEELEVSTAAEEVEVSTAEVATDSTLVPMAAAIMVVGEQGLCTAAAAMEGQAQVRHRDAVPAQEEPGHRKVEKWARFTTRLLTASGTPSEAPTAQLDRARCQAGDPQLAPRSPEVVASPVLPGAADISADVGFFLVAVLAGEGAGAVAGALV
jgi:hypothetical protein